MYKKEEFNPEECTQSANKTCIQQLESVSCFEWYKQFQANVEKQKKSSKEKKKKNRGLILILVQELKQLSFFVLQKRKGSFCPTKSWKNTCD